MSDNPYAPPPAPDPYPPQQPVYGTPPPAAPGAGQQYPAADSYPTEVYPAQTYPPAPYPAQPQPVAATASAPQTDGLAITAFVLSLCSWVVLPVILAIVALVLASNASGSIATSNGAKTGEGLVKAAKIIAWLNLLLFGLAIVFVIAFLIGLAVGG